MSNRKYRSNYSEFLYLYTQGKAYLDDELKSGLLKAGLIAVERSKFTFYNSRRYNKYILTEKAWRLLARRRRSRDQKLRPVRSLDNSFPNRYYKTYDERQEDIEKSLTQL